MQERLYVPFDEGSIVSVVSSLYKDRSNAFIETGRAIVIARDKMQGKDIEPELRNARRAAIEWHEFQEKEKKK